MQIMELQNWRYILIRQTISLYFLHCVSSCTGDHYHVTAVFIFTQNVAGNRWLAVYSLCQMSALKRKRLLNVEKLSWHQKHTHKKITSSHSQYMQSLCGISINAAPMCSYIFLRCVSAMPQAIAEHLRLHMQLL